jgi:hypothetical protein
MKQWNLAALVCLLSIALAGCSRTQLAYNQADFLLAHYADDYLGLTSDQLDRWEPRLEQTLAAHRRDELPYLAAYFDRVRTAARSGFPAPETACLVGAFRDLYKRHARLAVHLAAPLLAGLDPDQLRDLEERFARDLAQDLREPGGRDPARERRKRAKRWVESIEDWTGKLSPAQRALVAEMTGRFPNTSESVLNYRTGKRAELIAQLKSGAGEAELHAFLTNWLVEYRDLPTDLEQAGDALSERVADLVTALGRTLDQAQRERLNQRLTALRDDLLELQKAPHMAPLSC